LEGSTGTGEIGSGKIEEVEDDESMKEYVLW